MHTSALCSLLFASLSFPNRALSMCRRSGVWFNKTAWGRTWEEKEVKCLGRTVREKGKRRVGEGKGRGKTRRKSEVRIGEYGEYGEGWCHINISGFHFRRLSIRLPASSNRGRATSFPFMAMRGWWATGRRGIEAVWNGRALSGPSRFLFTL